jgi:phosphoribosylglycinamide formyltransferase 1
MADLPPMPPLSIAVLISGGGTTLQNLIDRIATGALHARIVLVISSRADAYGVVRAKQAGLPIGIFSRRDFPSTEAFSKTIFELCRQHGAELVCLGGFLHLLRIPKDFHGRVMNIHPALLPAFGGKGMYGRHVHQAVLAAGVKESGCTVHFVDNEYDHGPVIVQRRVPVLKDDTPETLAARVFEEECEAYPEAIRLYAEGKLRRPSVQQEKRNR